MKPASCDFETLLIVPCFNEAERLDLGAFERFLAENQQFRVMFVDDGSTDRTSRLILEHFSEDGQRCELLQLTKNVGKAEAIRQGFLHALLNTANSKPHYIGFLDADLATPLDEIVRATEVARRRTDISLVIGSRLPLSGRRIQRTLLRQCAGRLFATIASLMLGFHIRDTQCGAKLFRNVGRMYGIFDKPFVDRWIFDVELLIRLKIATGVSLRETVFEQPLESWRDVEGSRLKTSDFFRAFVSLIQIRLRYWGFASPADAVDQQPNQEVDPLQGVVLNSESSAKIEGKLDLDVRKAA